MRHNDSLTSPGGKFDDAAGVDAVSVGKTIVYQAKDPAAANGLAGQLAGVIGAGQKPGPTVPGMPAAKCFASVDANPVLAGFSCVAPAGRWVITSSAKQDFDATQQIAAQYLMLVGK